MNCEPQGLKVGKNGEKEIKSNFKHQVTLFHLNFSGKTTAQIICYATQESPIKVLQTGRINKQAEGGVANECKSIPDIIGSAFHKRFLGMLINPNETQRWGRTPLK